MILFIVAEASQFRWKYSIKFKTADSHIGVSLNSVKRKKNTYLYILTGLFEGEFAF